jgi:hypothetical protein
VAGGLLKQGRECVGIVVELKKRDLGAIIRLIRVVMKCKGE